MQNNGAEVVSAELRQDHYPEQNNVTAAGPAGQETADGQAPCWAHPALLLVCECLQFTLFKPSPVREKIKVK